MRSGQQCWSRGYVTVPVHVRYLPLGSPWDRPKRHVRAVSGGVPVRVRTRPGSGAVPGVVPAGYYMGGYTGYSPPDTCTHSPRTSRPRGLTEPALGAFLGGVLGRVSGGVRRGAGEPGCAEGPAGAWSGLACPDTRPRTNIGEIQSQIS